METMMKTGVTVRMAREGDDLSILKIADGQYVNRGQVWVAVSGDTVVGALVMWDGGHSVVKVDNFMVSPDHPSAGPKLILAFNEWCQQQGKTMMHYVTPSIELAYQAKQRGGIVNGPYFTVIYRITTQKGAHHA